MKTKRNWATLHDPPILKKHSFIPHIVTYTKLLHDQGLTAPITPLQFLKLRSLPLDCATVSCVSTAHEGPKVKTLVGSALTGRANFVGYDGQDGTDGLEFVANYAGNDAGKRHDWVGWGDDVVGCVFGDVGLVQLFKPIGLVVDEWVYFLWIW